MRKKKYGRTSKMGLAWHVRHLIDIIYHWILKNIFKRYPIHCSCFPGKYKLGFNLPIKTAFYKKYSPNQIAIVDIDEDEVYITLDTEKDRQKIIDDYNEVARKSFLSAAKLHQKQQENK